MSTKINNGYVVKLTNLKQLQTLAKQLQTKIQRKQRQLYAAVVAAEVLEQIDSQSVGIIKKPQEENDLGLLRSINNRIDRRIRNIKKTGLRDCAVDFECNVLFIPIKGKTLALFYSEQKAFNKIWEKCPEVKDYYFNNQSDHPKSIRDAEWKKRESDWDLALPDENPIPANNGFNITLSKTYDIPLSVKEVLTQIPNLEKRVNKISKVLLADRFIHKFEEEKDSNSFSAYGRLIEWSLGDDGQKELDLIKKEIRSKLKKKITKEDLLKV
jgi:hypothetical protein